MGFLASGKIWPVIAKLARGGRRRWCAVSYVTDARIINLQAKDRLVVDASDKSITGGATSAHELQRLLRLGVSIYSVPHLHSKLYLFEGELIVGSCNLSSSSQNALIEMAFHSTDPLEIRTAEDVFEKLVARGQVIDEKFVERILKLPVSQSSPGVEPSGSPQRLWRLKHPPIAIVREMQCYMQALFDAQLDGLVADVEFRLWPGPNSTEAFRAHMEPKNDRLRGGLGTYTLTSEGVTHFEKRKIDPTMLAQFLAAIRSGDSNDLPASVVHRELVPL